MIIFGVMSKLWTVHKKKGSMWLYDLNVKNFGNSNTHTFMYNEKILVLTN